MRSNKKQKQPQLHLTCGSLNECLAQRDNYEALFNSMHEGLIIVNSEQVVTMCNKPFLKATSLKKKEVVDRKIVDIFCDNQSCGINQAVIKTIRTGRPCRDEAMEITRSDGIKIPAIFSTSILRNHRGEETGIVVVFRDVSVVHELQKRLHERYHFYQIIGKNERMQDIYRLIEDVAATDANVLIQGQSGTGKELVANAIHYQSHRSDGPFIKVSCAALSETLLESELFGHVRGAFTGAYRDKPGRFEIAHDGTIFLDEIGEISPAVQIKLLRVLQEKEIERVGEPRTRKVNVRIVAATNKHLKQLVTNNIFREDLFYRLKVVTIDIPPLKQRKEDIPLLLEHFIKKYNQQYNKNITGCSRQAVDMLMEYSWDGNVRELENAVEHAFVKARQHILSLVDFPHEIRQHTPADNYTNGATKSRTITKASLLSALQESGWNQSKAARILGVNRVTVWRNIQKFNLIIPDY